MLCIISSGTENLNLIKLCQSQNIAYDIIADTLARPYDDREPDYIAERVQKLIFAHQETQGENKKEWRYLVSPSIEMGLHQSDPVFSQTYIFPLFTAYLAHCLTHSHSGRIGLLGGYSDLVHIEDYIKTYTENYTKTDYQSKTKKFLFPFALWCQEVPMRNYFLRLLSPRQMLINKIIKYDLKYLKDANVDTIIPLQYSYFRLQRTIHGFFNQKQQTFHGRDILEDILGIVRKTHKENTKVPNLSIPQSLNLYYSGSLHLLTNKKRETLLSSGRKYTLAYTKINV